MDLSQLIIGALEFIFPAYCANAIPVLAGGGLQIDFGKKFFDGRPLFGKNKTFRGFFAGLIVGAAVGCLESVVFDYHILLGFLIPLGALFGDLTGAFMKRRLDIPPGGLLPIVDQVDFIIGAIVFSLPLSFQMLSWQLVAMMMAITVPIHLLTNFVAYKLKLKSNPW
jgi:CDP-2,3-bis-(O-geranylgeranyl)-sn-glycerol synthase